MSTNHQPEKVRTVKPNGEVCRRMRIERGWDEAALAAKAGATRKTVANIEAGNRCFPFTLKGFSDAFGLPDMSQLLEPPHLIPPPTAGGNRVQVKIKLWLPFADCDFTRWLINLISKLIKLIDPTGDMEVVAVSPGSVIITLEMEANDAKKTVSAFGSGELDELDTSIGSITTNFGSGEPMEFTRIDRTPAPVTSTRSPAPKPQPKPQPSLLQRLSTWLFGERSPSDDPPPYREKGVSIFDRFKERQH